MASLWLRLKMIDLNPRYKESYGAYDARMDEKYLQHFERKNRNFIDNLPKYESSHKHSDVIWWCWLQGEENAPELCKACLASIRKNAKGKKVVVVTEDNYKDFVKLPDFIVEKYKNGNISTSHFSDILRLELLINHGGTWIDSSVLMTDYDEKLFNKDLFMFKCLLKDGKAASASNWFISSEINNPILMTTRDLLYKYWENHYDAERYFIFHILFTIATKKYPELWKAVPVFPNTAPHVLQFELEDEYNEERFKDICEMSSVHKLSQKKEFSKDKNTYYNYIVKKYLGK